ncbi:hypothetical protein GQ53DRAFT_524636 [Thozetella sp. PMI_491]|nr:hypothetical protein GQ53DRAFT_524636 [Thozetella sp. PMI_491]
MSVKELAQLTELWLRTGDRLDDNDEGEQLKKEPTDQFSRFPDLPAELRHEIWETAAATRLQPNVCVLTIEKSNGGELTHKPLVIRELCNEALEGTSQEAREIALRVRPRREYNPETDILYIAEEAFDYFTGNLCGRCRIPWASKVRHLAIPVNKAETGLHMPYALHWMDSLETFAIVYPQASGRVDCWANVPSPPEGGAVLRQLTDKEAAELVVSADYNYDTWHSPGRIVWNKSAPEHLEMVAGDHNRRAAPLSGDRIPPRWDPVNKRLRLTYRAMCFVS